MAGKPTDWDGMIAVYDRINKERALEPWEVDKLNDLIKRKQKAGYAKTYRENNKEKLAKDKAAYSKDPKNRKHINAARMRHHYKYRSRHLEVSKEWRERNPEKVADYKRRQKEKDQANG